jgi:hypothetical protein
MDYLDPVEAAVGVVERMNRYAWGLVTRTGLHLHGVLPEGSSRLDAQMATFAALLTHPQLAGAPVNLLSADEALCAALADLRKAIPNVEAYPYSARLTAHPMVRAARSVAHAALDDAGILTPRTVAATDGSFGRHSGRVGGWGWITDAGQYGY